MYLSSRNAEACDQAAAALNESGPGQAIALPGDISDEQGVLALVSAFSGHESKLNILVNNAGANWGAPLEEYPDAAWDKVLATNVKSVFLLTRALVPALQAAATHEDPARVINIGSIDGIQVPIMETYAYSASKAAVHQLTRTLAKRLAGEHVTVNAVAPGPFQSKMMKKTLEDFGEAIVAGVPRKRIGEPEDMAGVGDLSCLARRSLPDRHHHSGRRRHGDPAVGPVSPRPTGRSRTAPQHSPR